MIKHITLAQTLGKTFADSLDALVIDSGHLRYSKRDMVEQLGCPNFNAAGRLTKVLRRHGISTLSQLHRTSPFDLARVRGIGMTCLFVAMCLLDHGQYDVETWWGWKDTNVFKFSAFKAKAVARVKKRTRVRSVGMAHVKARAKRRAA